MLAVLVFLAIGTAVFSYEMLIGITYFIDDEGKFYPEGEGAVVASYRVQSRGKWFTAVGVVAAEEHQYGEEQLEEFREIIDEFLSEIEQMQ